MASFSKGKGKRPPSPRLVAICDIQPKMLDGYFEGRVMNRYGSFDHPGSMFMLICVIVMVFQPLLCLQLMGMLISFHQNCM
jgi:hypothetical protein